MGLKALLSEINSGIWLLHNPEITGYKEIVTGLRNGSFANTEPSLFESFLGINEKRLVERTDPEEELQNKVYVLDFRGELTKNTGMCNVGADLYVSKINQYNNDPSVQGFIFRLDGPGGNADVVPLFQELKGKMKKPVVALVDKACSLHYWIAAMMADHIMLSNDFTAQVGSIGVMVMFEKPERELIIIRPPQSADKNEEIVQALQGNTELMEEKLIPLAERFMADMKTFRPKVKDDVLHGKVLYAKEAIKAGLADSIGNLEKAYRLVMTKAELKKVKSK